MFFLNNKFNIIFYSIVTNNKNYQSRAFIFHEIKNKKYQSRAFTFHEIKISQSYKF